MNNEPIIPLNKLELGHKVMAIFYAHMVMKNFPTDTEPLVKLSEAVWWKALDNQFRYRAAIGKWGKK